MIEFILLAGMGVMLYMNYRLYKELKAAEAKSEEKLGAREQRILKAVRELHEEALGKMMKAFKSERRVWQEMLANWKRELADAIADSITAALSKAAPASSGGGGKASAGSSGEKMLVEKLPNAIRLPPIEYVRGELEFGARPPFKLRGIAGSLYVVYEDGNKQKRVAVVEVLSVSTDGNRVVIAPTPKTQ